MSSNQKTYRNYKQKLLFGLREEPIRKPMKKEKLFILEIRAAPGSEIYRAFPGQFDQWQKWDEYISEKDAQQAADHHRKKRETFPGIKWEYRIRPKGESMKDIADKII